jgi:hypothetical protein
MKFPYQRKFGCRGLLRWPVEALRGFSVGLLRATVCTAEPARGQTNDRNLDFNQ